MLRSIASLVSSVSPASLDGADGGGGGGADHSAFRSNDARGGMSGLLGANGEIPVIGVVCPCCPEACSAAGDSLMDTGNSGVTEAEVEGAADSDGSSSMWIKSPRLSSGSTVCAKSAVWAWAGGTGGGAPHDAGPVPEAEVGTTGDSGGSEAEGGFEWPCACGWIVMVRSLARRSRSRSWSAISSSRSRCLATAESSLTSSISCRPLCVILARGAAVLTRMECSRASCSACLIDCCCSSDASSVEDIVDSVAAAT